MRPPRPLSPLGLGVVGLTGAWTGRVVAERETLLGQMKTASGGSVARQISEIYGDAWHSTALVNGLFALLALLVGVFALVRPAFGAPAKDPQPGWVRAVATAGIALGVLGVLISVGMYFDLIVALPHGERSRRIESHDRAVRNNQRCPKASTRGA